MKKWKTINKFKVQSSTLRLRSGREFKVEDLIKILLENRGLKTKKEIDEFLNPKLENITIKNVGIDKKQLQKAIERIRKAIENKEKIVVFGDYDVDGICGTAILWETLRLTTFAQGKPYDNVFPYIPHRIDEGYGLSIRGIENLKLKIENCGLIITVDNGIVANKAVDFAKKQGIDVIITDHHVPSNPSTSHSTLRDESSGSDSKSSGLPKALAIVHTTKLCGAGVAWMLAKELNPVISNGVRDPNRSAQTQGIPRSARNDNNDRGSHLELVALATVADLVPLVGANRTLLKFGLQQLQKTKRIGLKALLEEAGIEQEKIGVYEIGHVIAPRINAMGRLDYAMDSLRLLCTNNRERATKLAQTLGSTNRERQELTLETVEHAKSLVYSSSESRAESRESREVLSEDSSRPALPAGRQARTIMRKLLFISHESYQQGVIGLVAGKLVEEFYRPSIVVSIGEKYSKASARSINSFNIIEFIRSASELLVDVGGHPMAAGFTVETSKLSILQKTLEEKAEKLLDEERLTRTLKIDCEIPLTFINQELYDEVQKLSPFGMGNPEPVFVSRAVTVEDIRVVGKEGNHLKLVVSQKTIARMTRGFDSIGFGMGERASEFHAGDKVDVVYTIDEDTWNGNERLQLKIKDIKKS